MIKPCALCRRTPKLEKSIHARGGLWAMGDVMIYHLGCPCGRGATGFNRAEVIANWNDQADDLELARESRAEVRRGAAR